MADIFISTRELIKKREMNKDNRYFKMQSEELKGRLEVFKAWKSCIELDIISCYDELEDKLSQIIKEIKEVLQ